MSQDGSTANIMHEDPAWLDLGNRDHWQALAVAHEACRLGTGLLIAEHLLCRRYPGRRYIEGYKHGYIEAYTHLISAPWETTFHRRAAWGMRDLIANCTDHDKALRQVHVAKAMGQLERMVKVLLVLIADEVRCTLQNTHSEAFDHAGWAHWRDCAVDIGDTTFDLPEPPVPKYFALIDAVVQPIEPVQNRRPNQPENHRCPPPDTALQQDARMT